MNLLERFPKFEPSDELIQYMYAEVDKLKVDKEQRMMEAVVTSSIIVPKAKLYQIEAEIKAIYKLNYFRIF